MAAKRDRLANLFRRLSRILDGDRALPSEKPLSALTSQNAKELREAFLAELKFLDEKRSDVYKTFGKELSETRQIIERASDKDFYSQIEAIKDILARIRRSLFRSALALQSDRQIQAEWAEWKRLAAHAISDPIKSHVQRERLEMLSSERVLRRPQSRDRAQEAIELKKLAQEPSEPSARPEVNEESEPVTMDAPLPLFTKQVKKPVNLEAWDDYYTSAVLEHARYWEDLISDFDEEAFASPYELADLYRNLRRAHGELRLHDRERRIRRYRLKAFTPQD